MMKIIHRALIAVALLTGSFALAAQSHDHGRAGHDGHRGSSQSHGNRNDNGRHGDSRQHSDNRHYDNRQTYHRSAPPVRYYNPRHRYSGPRHRFVEHHRGPRYVVRHNRWARGHRYYGPNYVVSNYGYYRLRPPPRGYHWVRDNNDYLLVAIATGVILDIALH